jgi:hypothetical protein
VQDDRGGHDEVSSEPDGKVDVETPGEHDHRRVDQRRVGVAAERIILEAPNALEQKSEDHTSILRQLAVSYASQSTTRSR